MKSLSLLAAAATLSLSMGLAHAQGTTTTTTSSTWSNDQGTMFRDYSTTKKYTGYTDPAMKPAIGMELPGAVTVYPLPETMKVPTPEKYSYSIINNQPVVVERTSRKVVRVWE